jgi:hypothetical protein
MNKPTIIMQAITLNDLRQKFGKGRFATVTFKKLDGTTRVLNGKTKVKRGITGGGEVYNATHFNQLRVFDVNIRKNGVRVGGYRTVTADNVIDVRANKVVYKITG